MNKPVYPIFTAVIFTAVVVLFYSLPVVYNLVSQWINET